MNIYQNRYYKVIRYIDSHLDESLSIERLSEVVHLSHYHFQRQFSALFDLSVFTYIKQLRIKRAAYQLAFRSESKVIDIALNSGYESSEAFSRAFKGVTKQTPSSFRKQPDWTPWQNCNDAFDKLRSFKMKYTETDFTVNVIEIEAIQIGVLEHRGDPNLLNNTISKFIQWRKENNLSPRVSRTFNLLYDDPNATEPENYRFDLCASLSSDIAENIFGAVTKVIPAGRYAVVRHKGGDEYFEGIIKYLYSDWLINNNEELRDFPLFFERVSFFPDVAEADMVTDIYLPIR